MRPEFLNDEMRDLYREGNLSQIITRCQEMLSELRAMHGDNHPEIVAVLDELARSYYELCDYPAAIESTKQLLEIESNLGGKATADFARNVSNLGLLYIFIDRLDEAELALESAVELTRRLPTNEQWVIPGALINLASVYRQRRDFARAERVLVEALKLRLENHGWWDPKYGNVFLHFSHLYWKMGRRDAAERSLRKAMRIYQDASHTETTEYSGMLVKLGDMHARQSKTDDARKSYRSALEILRRVRPEFHGQFAKIEERIARLTVPI